MAKLSDVTTLATKILAPPPIEAHEHEIPRVGQAADPDAAAMFDGLIKLEPTNATNDVHVCHAFHHARIHERCDYCSLDDEHRKSISALALDVYEYANDRSRHRPLSFLIKAAPGTGKSFFVESLANAMDELNDNYVPFNMASLTQASDLEPAVEAVRNLRVRNKLPLLLLDEYDADPARATALLPLVWDGEMLVRGRSLRLGKVVVALAGSRAEVSELIMSDDWVAAEDSRLANWPKLPDLRSRINAGHIELPVFNREIVKRQVDKVVVFLGVLRGRFNKRPHLIIPHALVRFVADSDFEYSSRSISRLVEFLPQPDENHQFGTPALDDRLGRQELIRRTGLLHHVTRTSNADDIVRRWNNAKAVAPNVTVSIHGRRCANGRL